MHDASPDPATGAAPQSAPAPATGEPDRRTPEQDAELRALGFDPDDPPSIVARLRRGIANVDAALEAGGESASIQGVAAPGGDPLNRACRTTDEGDRDELLRTREIFLSLIDEVERDHADNEARHEAAEALGALTDMGRQQLRDSLAPVSVQVEVLGKTHLLAQQAELICAAALESLCEKDEDGNYRWSAGHEHGLACPPSLAGFAAVHCRLSRTELGALARLVRSERTQPEIRSALRRGILTPRAARRLRAIANGNPGILAEWLAAAEGERRFTFERRTERALPGDLPSQVDPDRPMPEIAPKGPTPAEGLRLQISLGLPHMDAYWWHLASARAGRATKKGYLGALGALRAITEKLASEVAAGLMPAALDAIAPFGEFHIDPISNEAWAQAARHGLGLSIDEIPKPGSKVVVEILSEERARLAHSRAAALLALPELADDVLPPNPGDADYERFRRTGIVTWGISRLMPDPARALPARDHEAVLTAEAAVPPDAVAAPLEGRRGGLADDSRLWTLDSGLPGAVDAPGSPGDPVNTAAAAEAVLATLGPRPGHQIASLGVAQRQALAVACARIWHASECRESELVVQASPDLDACPPDSIWATLDALGYFEGEAPLLDRRVLVKQLEALPQIRNTCDAGLCTYTHARIAARKTSSHPEHDAAWADLAQRCDTTELQAFARATPAGEAPPQVPEGTLPIRPAGGKLPLQLRGHLDGDAATALDTILKALAKLAGRELSPAEWVPLIAKWYCQVTQKWTHHTVIYHRSPMTRGAEFPRAHMAKALWNIPPGPPGSTRRLEAAMAWITDWDAEKPDRRAHRRLEAGERYTPPVIEDIVRWMDGGGCRTPGCTNDTSQHDHGIPVGEGGHANSALDGRRCGPDNRGRNEVRHPDDPAGAAPKAWLDVEHGPFGSEICRDRWGRRLGSVRRLYAAWDEPVRRWLARRAHDEWLESPTLINPFWDAVETEEFDDPAVDAYWRARPSSDPVDTAEPLANPAGTSAPLANWADNAPDLPPGDPRWGFF